MKVQKICEYLNEIGILEYENINIFLNTYSTLNNKNYSSKANKVTDALKIYLNNNYIKNNQTSKLCENILSSYDTYNNYQIVIKNQALNNVNKILLSMLNKMYTKFFLNLSIYILKKNKKSKGGTLNKKSKSKKKIKKYDKYEEEDENNKNINKEENTELISSDDERECTFTPKINKDFKGYKKNNIKYNYDLNNIESKVIYSPAFNISAKYPINKQQINIYSNQNYQDNNNSYYSYNYNNNDLNLSNDNRNNVSNYTYNQSARYMPNQELNNNPNILYNNNNYLYNNQNVNMNNMIMNNKNNLYNNNGRYNYQNYMDNIEHNPDLFYNKEMEFKQKVKNKINNIIIEKNNKLKEECPFIPKINKNYKSFYPPKEPKNIQDNIQTIQEKNKMKLETIKEQESTEKKIEKKKDMKKRAKSEKKKGIKIIEDLSLARKKRTEKTKKLMKERNFTPKIKKNDKYKVTMSFEDRRLKSIELRNKYKKTKKPENEDININNNEAILAPSEMVRYKENNNDNDNNINNNINENNMKNQNYNSINKEPNEINNIQPEENMKDINLINDNEIEKNKISLMDKIKGEHKIGFKYRKEENNNEIKNTEENEPNKITESNTESISKLDLDTNNKNFDISYKNMEIKSKGLKDILKKNEE